MQIKSQISNLHEYKKYLKVVASIESFLNLKGFLKLDLPVLVPALIPESYLEIFETEYVFFDKREKLYLTPSPELLIKRLIAEGIGDCYCMGKSFRNSEPASSKHNGEFTMLEMYKVGGQYMEMATIVLEMLQDVASSSQGSVDRINQIIYQGKSIDLSRWEKLTVAEAFEKYANIKPDELFDHVKFMGKAEKKGYKISKTDDRRLTPFGRSLRAEPYHFSYEELWSQIYATEVEPHLGCNGFPTLLYDYPVEFAALSKPNSDGKTAQRFEFYIAGVELGNCYGELTDWKLQEKRLKMELEERKKSGKIEHKYDSGFLDCLKKGMTECTGIAIGIDRLAMIFADVSSIDELKLIAISE